MWRCLLCFLTPRGVPATTTETCCNSWKNHGKSIHGKSMENRMEKPWGNHGKLNGKSMGNPWIIKKQKRKCFRGTPWGPHGDPWGPMEYHGNISFFPFLLSMDFPWIFLGISHGCFMVFPWFSHSFSMDFSWIDFSWISMNYKMFPWWLPEPLLA